MFALATLALHLALAQADAGAQWAPTSFAVKAIPEASQLGQPFVVEYQVTHPGDTRVELKAASEDGAFDILGEERKREGDVTTFRVRMAAFALDATQTPSLTFDIASPQGSTTWVAPGAKFSVVGTLSADAKERGEEPKDVRGPLEVVVRSWTLLYIAAALAALALLTWALLKYLRRPKPVKVEAPKIVEPLHVRATRDLDALRMLDLPSKGQAREFYFRLSDIVRAYLGERYDFDALECTSPELLTALRRTHTPGLSTAELSTFVNDSDMAKYAKDVPDADRCKASLEFAYKMVRSTTAAFTALASPGAHDPR